MLIQRKESFDYIDYFLVVSSLRQINVRQLATSTMEPSLRENRQY